MKWLNQLISLTSKFNHSWFVQWANQWWIRAITQIVGSTFIAGYFLPKSGLRDISSELVPVFGCVVLVTAAVQGSIWLWRRGTLRGGNA
jgi:hypothetical protein